MMRKKCIDGQIRKIESKSDFKIFYDFEFWAESDEDTYGLLCLIQISNPKKLFITEMNSDEIAISNVTHSIEAVKSRVIHQTGIPDLEFPKVIRFEGSKSDVRAGFQEFLKSYKEPVAVYENIFEKSQEAIQVKELSIDEFKRMGGEIHILGNISILK